MALSFCCDNFSANAFRFHDIQIELKKLFSSSRKRNTKPDTLISLGRFKGIQDCVTAK